MDPLNYKLIILRHLYEHLFSQDICVLDDGQPFQLSRAGYAPGSINTGLNVVTLSLYSHKE